MKKLLLLDNRFSPDTTDMWKTAIGLGWKTERPNMYNVRQLCEGHEYVRYYGNTLHAEQIVGGVPFKFTPIDYSILAKCPEQTKRNISFVRFDTVAQPVKQTRFIKPTGTKWFEAKVYNEGENIIGSTMGDDMIYVSDVVKFIDEVRCFVLDGEVLTSSLYRIGRIAWDASNENPEDINFDSRLADTPIPQMVKEICTKHKLPRGVVIDFGYTSNNEWVLIEFNEAWASGMYYCNYTKCLDVIVESQENLIDDSQTI